MDSRPKAKKEVLWAPNQRCISGAKLQRRIEGQSEESRLSGPWNKSSPILNSISEYSLIRILLFLPRNTRNNDLFNCQVQENPA